jgi:DNA-binding transcriptional ArsR family regulator
MATEDILKLDPTVHSPVRLAVLSILVSVEEAEFNYLKQATKSTDGNLSTHLSKLEGKGYIRVMKAFKGKKPVTTCRITAKGRGALSDYVKALEGLLQLKEY